MLRLFRCKHPFHRLAVEKEHTVTPVDADFNDICYHLFCRACGQKLKLPHAEMIGGVKEFLKRPVTQN